MCAALAGPTRSTTVRPQIWRLTHALTHVGNIGRSRLERPELLHSTVLVPVCVERYVADARGALASPAACVSVIWQGRGVNTSLVCWERGFDSSCGMPHIVFLLQVYHTRCTLLCLSARRCMFAARYGVFAPRLTFGCVRCHYA